MALKRREVIQLAPIDTKRNVAVGVALPMGGTPIFKSTYTTEEQSVSNLKLLLLTRKGERLMQPLFGTQIVDTLFENISEDLNDVLKDMLTEDINFWLPYIVLDTVDVKTNPDYNSIKISIIYKTNETGANKEIILNIDEQGGLSIA